MPSKQRKSPKSEPLQPDDEQIGRREIEALERESAARLAELRAEVEAARDAVRRVDALSAVWFGDRAYLDKLAVVCALHGPVERAAT